MNDCNTKRTRHESTKHNFAKLAKNKRNGMWACGLVGGVLDEHRPENSPIEHAPKSFAQSRVFSTGFGLGRNNQRLNIWQKTQKKSRKIYVKPAAGPGLHLMPGNGHRAMAN